MNTFPLFAVTIWGELVRVAKTLAKLATRPFIRKPLASQHRSGGPVSQPRRIWFEIIDTTSLDSRSVAVPVPNEAEAYWRVGMLHSGAELEIDEPQLDGIELFITGASNHLILTGTVVDRASLPALGVGQREATGEWNWKDPMWKWALQEDNQLYIRFDYRWLRIGRHAIRATWKPMAGDGPPT